VTFLDGRFSMDASRFKDAPVLEVISLASTGASPVLAGISGSPSVAIGVPALVAMLVASFLCGSVPFALLLGRLRGIDIRTVGSGNIGATNLGRALGRRWGVACFVLDAFKGAAPVAAFGLWRGIWGIPLADATSSATTEWLAVAVAAILGHVFSPWVGFRGGKGVATGFGALVALWPLLTWPLLGALLAWAILLAATRLMAVASIVAACAPPAVLLIQSLQADRPAAATPLLVATLIIAALVMIRHRSNLARILAGTEPRIGTPDPESERGPDAGRNPPPNR
jgi:glycerol-3-phosphate acyltransferase PlsY